MAAQLKSHLLMVVSQNVKVTFIIIILLLIIIIVCPAYLSIDTHGDSTNFRMSTAADKVSLGRCKDPLAATF